MFPLWFAWTNYKQIAELPVIWDVITLSCDRIVTWQFTNYPWLYMAVHCSHLNHIIHVTGMCDNKWENIKADSRLAHSQWETSLQSNAVSHWLGANLESALNIKQNQRKKSSRLNCVHHQLHYCDVIMSAKASQNTCVSIVYSTVCSGADHRKHQSFASLAFVPGIHRWPVKIPRTKGQYAFKSFHLMTPSCTRHKYYMNHNRSTSILNYCAANVIFLFYIENKANLMLKNILSPMIDVNSSIIPARNKCVLTPLVLAGNYETTVLLPMSHCFGHWLYIAVYQKFDFIAMMKSYNLNMG